MSAPTCPATWGKTSLTTGCSGVHRCELADGHASDLHECACGSLHLIDVTARPA